MESVISWFEIPATDFKRAIKFYTAVLQVEITEMEMPNGMQYGVFPHDKEKNEIGGGIVDTGGLQKPGVDGTTVYLNGGDNLLTPLSRVEAAGGTVVMTKTSIGENGFFALFIDTEGNKLALHSMT